MKLIVLTYALAAKTPSEEEGGGMDSSSIHRENGETAQGESETGKESKERGANQRHLDVDRKELQKDVKAKNGDQEKVEKDDWEVFF